MTMLASQITSLMVVYSIVYSGVNQRIHQSSASLAFVREIHRGPVNFPHKWPVTRKMFPFDDVIMKWVQIGTHRKHPIPHPSRQAIGCLLLGFGENWPRYIGTAPLHWRHNDNDGVSNHQPHGCLLNRLFRRRSKKTSKLRVTGLCVGNSPGPVNSPHKGPVTRKMFPFDDVIMLCMNSSSPHLLGIHKSIWFFNDILTVPTHVYLGGKLGYAKS